MNVPTSSLWPIVFQLATGRSGLPSNASEAKAFIDCADRERLLPLLLDDPDVPPVVEEMRTHYRAFAALHRRRFEIARGAIVELQRVLGPETFLLLKGSDYRARLYPHPHHRPVADIDIFIPRALVQPAVKALENAGHRRVYSAHGNVFSKNFYELAFSVGGMRTEVHRSFAQPVRAHIDYGAVWERRTHFSGASIEGFRLSPADAIAYHAVSLAKDEFSAYLVRYLDMHLLMRHCEASIEEAVSLAKEWQTERALYGAIALTRSLFPDSGGEPAQRALRELLTPRIRRMLDLHVLPDPRREPSGHTLGRRTQLWRKFWLMDRIWRRGAFFVYHAAATAEGYVREFLMRRGGRIGNAG